MGWRFRKLFRLAPGVRLNLGRGGITSLSVGHRGATVNLGKRGVTGSVSVPGTGLSYQHRFSRLATGSSPRQVSAPSLVAQPNTAGSGGWTTSPRTYFVVAIVLVVGYLALRTPTSTSPGGSGGTVLSTAPAVAAPQPEVSAAPAASTLPTAGQFSDSVGPIPYGSHTAVAGPATSMIRAVTVIQTANVRASPAMSGAVLRTLPKGASVQVLQVESGWLRVGERNSEALGWVHSSLLK
jgi:hypothetical protein